ncbi:MAG: DUF1329 domain-containing protein, partial [Pseudomonadales bacterium]|nr:DUF1329 domain-containing protein [Pseudomonadales bacterium]
MSLTIACASSAVAKVSEQEAKRLGSDLTPTGALAVGNAAGTIPAWTGGITEPPAGYKVGDFHPSPFPGETTLFTITAQNYKEYAEHLTPGQIALLKQYDPGYFIPVYKTHRSASYPDWIYKKLKENATAAILLEHGNGVKNTIATSPFPIPENGVEVIWNHTLRFRGEQAESRAAFVTPTQDGSFTPTIMDYEYYFTYSQPGMELADIDNKIFYLRIKIMAPAKLAGTLNLVHETLDQIRSPRKAWRYEAGTRRLRRSPNLAYGTDFPNGASLRTVDQEDMYNGAPVQYTWELLGKKEIYVPYNAYKLHSGDLKLADIVRPKHINQELTRYELHRVWVVEGVLREGIGHVYAKRRLYFDEDSWHILLTEEYNS